ncbi:hypothetical protein MBOT_40640 [Mycobacterium botniense]|uniref:Uncharacterized protein n=1 Tax=Mycobacterium botniense TaxID=84962 RepID=A0A7I9Y3Q6_9MYCO|nr:hypothetical protein MBOT_40640 [Mycobacterium botniense]
MAATRFTLAWPESMSTPAACRCSVAQPRVEIRSTKWWAPGRPECMAPSSPPSGTPAGLRNMHLGLAGPPATSATLQRAAAQGGAAGSSTYMVSAANDSETNRQTNAFHSSRLRSHNSPATT